MTKEAKKKPRCFVISPIGLAGSPERLHANMVLNSIVRQALPEDELHIQRSDEFGKPEMISTQMMEAIWTWELAVAVLTFRNPNVFYELGLRHMASKPVVHIAEVGTELPFDNAGMATIWYKIDDWESHVAARKEVANHFKAAMAKNYQGASNPVTAARAHIQFAESADTKEQVLADIVSRLGALEAKANQPKVSLSELYPELITLRSQKIPKDATTLKRLFDNSNAEWAEIEGRINAQLKALKEAGNDDSTSG